MRAFNLKATWLWSGLLLLLLPATAEAGTISFTNQTVDDLGTGFGNVLSLLVVHASPTEFGSVFWNGASDVIADNATNQSSTRTAGELLSAGITPTSGFSLIFNINEPGGAPELRLFDFALRFTDSTGAPLFSDLVYDAPVAGLELTQVGGGTGGAGWRFTVDLTPTEATAFYGDTSNRLGMYIESGQAITMSAGGPDSFYVGSHAAVPEPSTWVLAAVGALGFVAVRAVRGRRLRT